MEQMQASADRLTAERIILLRGNPLLASTGW
jgi:hypothetical protein